MPYDLVVIGTARATMCVRCVRRASRKPLDHVVRAMHRVIEFT